MADTKAKKQAYFAKLVQLLEEYSKILLVEATNVGSNQMQQIRKQLRGTSVVLMGKNTMIRKVIRSHLAKNPSLEELLPHVRGNIGFIFTKGDLGDVKKKVEALKVDAPAKVGTIAPSSVTVPAGPTGLEPTQTSFLQALNIPSKINKGQVEIINDFLLIKTGDRIGQSEAALLSKLNIRPFSYGLKAKTVFDDGNVYGAEVLSMTDQDILDKFIAGVRNVAALGLALSFPTTAALPHVLVNGYKNVLAIAFATEFSFPRAEKLKKAAAAGPAPSVPPAAAKGGPKEEKKEEKKPEKEEPAEEEADMGLSLFD
jgi:large subunit ribosomal protein LP0